MSKGMRRGRSRKGFCLGLSKCTSIICLLGGWCAGARREGVSWPRRLCTGHFTNVVLIDLQGPQRQAIQGEWFQCADAFRGRFCSEDQRRLNR